MALKHDSAAPLFIFATACFGLCALLVIGHVWGPDLLINATDSEPTGIYRILPSRSAELSRGALVIFPIPQPFESLVVGRGWEKKGVPLIKSIGAIEGDEVCVRDTIFEINGTPVGPVASVDRAGLPLPKLRGCFRIEAGYFLPVSTYSARSFDGRYMGPQPLSVITGEAKPLWTF
jgi:conjugative transfer signal peptidase TraF